MVEEVAMRGHMDSFVLADTFGVATPQAVWAMMKRIKARFKQPVEAHCHMQFGLGVANTVAALAAGADVAHVTVAGLGEGPGNVPIEDVAMSLKCLYGVDVGLNTEHFLDTAKFVCKVANNHAIPVNRPILGERVFKVESGIGVMFATNAAKAGDMEILYSFNPALVGQPPMDFVLGKKSGTFTIDLWLERIGRTADEKQNLEILAKVKELALKKKELLTKEEFVEIVDKVLGPPAKPPKPGNPILDQQVSRAGKAWHASKQKAAGVK
jgi:isopropylmalate/homocitrate/citramalate synthase